MNKIESFKVDHRKITPGIYISRKDFDVVTYDLRMRKPNCGDLIDNATIHSLEHMFATYIRNSEISENVLYFGPMGCQTGFYLLTKGLDDSTVLKTVKSVLKEIIEHNGEIYGKSEIECGNYRNLDLQLAKNESSRYLDVLNSSVCDFKYPE